MGRPKGKQIPVKCTICGTVRSWPPSKAKGKKFCSVPCRDLGSMIVAQWSMALDWIDRGCLPPGEITPDGPDPDDRIRLVDGRWFVRDDADWFELQIDGRRIDGREQIAAEKIPEGNAA